MAKPEKQPDEVRAFRTAREFWYRFFEKTQAAESQVTAVDVALQLFDRSDYKLNMGLVNARLQDLMNFAKSFREELMTREIPASPDQTPLAAPLVVFHPVDRDSISKTAIGPEDGKAAQQREQRPVSWLFQKRFGKVMLPCIAVDRDCISGTQAVSEINVVVLRVILHEICHYLMHFRTLLPAGLPSNQFHYEWANKIEEEEAWIGGHTVIAFAIAAIAVGSRIDGGFDAAWKYP